MAKIVATVKAVVTRLVFAAHGLLAIWQAVVRRREPLLWYLSVPIILLFFEGLFTLTVKRNQEWKWFCPSVFLYLGSVVPAIWLLELDKLDRRLSQMSLSSLGASVQPQAHTGKPSAVLNETPAGDVESTKFPEGGDDGSGGGITTRLSTVTEHPSHGEDIGKDFDKILTQLHLPPSLTRAIPSELWVTLLEQSLMLALILGRWLLPKGELTREQLSQLLLVYIGTAADIIEFLDSFKEDRVARQPILVTLTLSIWAWSLLQFTLVLTATKARRSRMSSSAVVTSSSPRPSFSFGKSDDLCCCSVDAWAIVINMVLQDAPFVAFRLLLIIHFRIVSYLNVFFACKNTLVILLQLYRLYVVQVERRKQTKRRRGRVKNLSKNTHRDKRRDPLTEGVSIVGGPELYRFGRGLKLERRRSESEDSDSENSENLGEELRSIRSSPCTTTRKVSESPTRYKVRKKSLSTGNLKGSSDFNGCSDECSDQQGLEEVVTLKELREIRRRARQDLLLLLAAEPTFRRNRKARQAPELEVE